MKEEDRALYAPCPTCKQYSHSIGADAVSAAFNHFQTMIAHPLRGTPMGHAFDETTRDAAQVLMSLATPPPVIETEGSGTYAEFQQRRGRLPDLIEEAIEIHRGFMLDDDYDAHRCLDKIVAKLKDARDFYDPKTPAVELSTDREARADFAHPTSATAGSAADGLREALDRQCDNMAFLLNHAELSDQWFSKFSRELGEDRAALALAAPDDITCAGSEELGDVRAWLEQMSLDNAAQAQEGGEFDHVLNRRINTALAALALGASK